MISFLLCLAILIVGYFVYGKIVDNTFGPDDRETPAVRINDGVDYVVMPQWKPCRAHCGARWSFCGSPSAPSLQAACTTTSPA